MLKNSQCFVYWIFLNNICVDLAKSLDFLMHVKNSIVFNSKNRWNLYFFYKKLRNLRKPLFYMF
jgi:hypothetical protein